jgi:pimeloyl-ACP methyl ester carboxylesterase
VRAQRQIPYLAGQLAVEVWSDGPPVLLLHGWGGNARDLHTYIDPLVARGFSVVSVDFPAHGSSAGRRTNLLECADATGLVASGLPPLAGIVAHSFGAAAAAMALARGAVLSERTVMLGPPADIPSLSFRVVDRMGLPRHVAERMYARLAARLQFSWEEIRTDRLVARSKTSLLVVHDEEDEVVPWSHGAAVARAAERSRLYTTSGLGHRGTLVDTNVVRGVVEFMAG